jgi:putative membrane protein
MARSNSSITSAVHKATLALSIGLSMGVNAWAQTANTTTAPSNQTSGKSTSGDITSTTTTSSTNTSSGRTAKNSFSKADQRFLTMAAEANLAEIKMGQLAQQRASNEQIKQFGARMVQEHTQAHDEVKRLASAKNITLPEKPSRMHQQHASRLSRLSGTEFDREFMRHMVNDHKKTVNEFEKAANSAQDSEVKALAASMLLKLKEHEQMAHSLHDSSKERSGAASNRSSDMAPTSSGGSNSSSKSMHSNTDSTSTTKGSNSSTTGTSSGSTPPVGGTSR